MFPSYRNRSVDLLFIKKSKPHTDKTAIIRYFSPLNALTKLKLKKVRMTMCVYIENPTDLSTDRRKDSNQSKLVFFLI